MRKNEWYGGKNVIGHHNQIHTAHRAEGDPRPDSVRLWSGRNESSARNSRRLLEATTRQRWPRKVDSHAAVMGCGFSRVWMGFTHAEHLEKCQNTKKSDSRAHAHKNKHTSLVLTV